MTSVAGVVFLALAAVAAAGVVVATRSGGRPGPWLGAAGLATIVVYLYGAAESLGDETSTASWVSVIMAVLVVTGVVALLIGRPRATTLVVAVSAAAIALGAVGIILTATS